MNSPRKYYRGDGRTRRHRLARARAFRALPYLNRLLQRYWERRILRDCDTTARRAWYFAVNQPGTLEFKFFERV